MCARLRGLDLRMISSRHRRELTVVVVLSVFTVFPVPRRGAYSVVHGACDGFSASRTAPEIL
jgi:hypothetical protein